MITAGAVRSIWAGVRAVDFPAVGTRPNKCENDTGSINKYTMAPITARSTPPRKTCSARYRRVKLAHRPGRAGGTIIALFEAIGMAGSQ